MRAVDLLEDNDIYQPIGFDDGGTLATIRTTLAFIKDYCQPWITSTNIQTPVYRGTGTTNSVFFRKVRPDRRPRDTSERIHALYNKLIDMAGGVANRSNSAFVSSYTGTAHIYGSVRVAIPIGEFNYTWSPVWGDWYTGLTDSTHMLIKIMHPAEGQELKTLLHRRYNGISQGGDSENIDRLIYDLTNYDLHAVKATIYTDKNLKEAIASGNEIMIKCDAVLYIHPELYFDHIVPNLTEK